MCYSESITYTRISTILYIAVLSLNRSIESSGWNLTISTLLCQHLLEQQVREHHVFLSFFKVCPYKNFLASDEMKGKVYHLVELDELYRMKLFATFDWVALSERFLNNCVEKDRKTWSSIHYQKSWSSVRKCVDFFTKRFAVKFCIWRYTFFGNLSVGRLAFLPAPVLSSKSEINQNEEFFAN